MTTGYDEQWQALPFDYRATFPTHVVGGKLPPGAKQRAAGQRANRASMTD